MDFFENRYYNITRICLSLIGLWPTMERRTRLIRILFINVIVLALLVTQIITISSLELSNSDMVDEVLTNFFVFLFIITVYYNILFNASKVHKLLNDIKDDWLEKEDTKEFEIMKEYAEKCRIFSLSILAIYYISLLSIVLLSVLPLILDTVVPLNETRVRSLPFPIKCFFDEQENYCWLTLLFCIILSIIGLTLISSYSLFAILLLHLCGMFYVTGNMLESAFYSKIPVTNDYFENERYAKIVLSIKYHKKALKFNADINALYEYCFIVSIILGGCTLAFQFLRVLRTDSFELKYLKRTVVMILHVFTNIGLAFLNCYLGQKIIDHSTFLFDKAFDIPWYMLSKRSQMLVWFIMARSIQPCYLSIRNLFPLSVKIFASIIQTSLSYATVVYSLR